MLVAVTVLVPSLLLNNTFSPFSIKFFPLTLKTNLPPTLPIFGVTLNKLNGTFLPPFLPVVPIGCVDSVASESETGPPSVAGVVLVVVSGISINVKRPGKTLHCETVSIIDLVNWKRKKSREALTIQDFCGPRFLGTCV